MTALAAFKVTVYGPFDQRYSDLLRSIIHCFYNSAIREKDLLFVTKMEYASTLIISLVFYFLQSIFIISVHQAIFKNEYNFCEKAKD